LFAQPVAGWVVRGSRVERDKAANGPAWWGLGAARHQDTVKFHARNGVAGANVGGFARVNIDYVYCLDSILAHLVAGGVARGGNNIGKVWGVIVGVTVKLRGGV